jgi:ABC-type dipeptide/oligopeptide/nickel transport system permease subunit
LGKKLIEADLGVIESRTPGQIAWLHFKRNRIGVASGILSISFLIGSILAPLECKLLGINPDELNLGILDESGVPKLPWGGISLNHPLGIVPGTGRDLLAQLLYGSRISFLVMIVSTFITLFVGMLAGVVGGFFGGKVDNAIGRYGDFILAFPSFFMIVALADPMVDRIQRAGIARENGARILFLIVILSFFGWVYFARLIRSQVLSLRELDFITAAKALGSSKTRIIFKELIPNIWAPVIVVVSLSLPGYLTAEAVFSFLGIGVQPPGYTWGLLIAKSTRFVMAMPTFFLITTGTLVMVVLAFNLLGDALRDAFDPRNGK